MQKLSLLYFLCVAVWLNSALGITNNYPSPSPWQPEPNQREHLRRSLTLLGSSTPTNHHTVRVLIYGQSISQQAWWKEIENYLQTIYPNANVILENRALGGHAAQLLVKTAEADLYPFQPDLLIFHVYGSHIEYDNIIRRVRERTCADILLQTDHVTRDDMLTEETDPAKLTTKQWDAWMNNSFLPETAEKHAACRADIHNLWKGYLQTNHLKAAELLRDGVHLNSHGEWLMAELLKPYLAPLPAQAGYVPNNEACVRTVPLLESVNKSAARLEFTGTRADLIFRPEAKGSVTVLIDGIKPSAIPQLYGFTRVSAFPNSDWPILLKVDSQKPLIAEDWAVKLDHISERGKVCHFTLRGSVTGEDGEGWSTNRFVSHSGRVVLEPEDWNLAYCMAVFHRDLPDGHVAHWQAVFRGADSVVSPATLPGLESCVTVAQTLAPGKHTLELRGENLDQLLQAARFYSPPGNHPANS